MTRFNKPAVYDGCVVTVEPVDSVAARHIRIIAGRYDRFIADFHNRGRPSAVRVEIFIPRFHLKGNRLKKYKAQSLSY